MWDKDEKYQMKCPSVDSTLAHAKVMTFARNLQEFSS
jgi:hypothetical protein